MALLGSRQIWQTNIDCTVSGVAERGGVLSFVPGVAGLCAYADATAVSGQLVNPAGLLLDDVEDINYMRNPEYRQRNVVPLGSVVGIAVEAELHTDFVETGTLTDGQAVGTYVAGDPLFLGDLGEVSRNNGTFGNGATAIRVSVGNALGTVSADGFLKIRLEL